MTDGEAGAAGAAESAKETAKSPRADGGGDGNVETAGAESKPIMTDEQLAAWKEKTRREMMADLRKQAKDEAKREADSVKAKESGDYQKLAEDAQAELAALKQQLADRDRADLRRAVAAKHKLPESLASRLQGETETDLEEDAKAIVKLLGAPRAADTEAGKTGKSASVSDKPTPPAAADKSPAYTFDGRKKVPWPSRGG